MPSTTTIIKAFFGSGGPSGTPGVVIYEADGSTVKLAHTTAGITQVGTTKSFIKTVTVDFDTEYNVIFDDGGTPLPVSTLFLPTGVNMVTVNGQPVRNGNGVAVAVTTTTIDLDITDPYRAANLVGWTVEVIGATTGAGQVATITASGITSPFRQTFAAWTLPTGPVAYKLNPPVPSTTVDTTAIANATVTAYWASTGHLGDGSKTVAQTETKGRARLYGKIDIVSVPGYAIFYKVDGSGEAFREPYGGTPARGNHVPGSGL